MRISSFTQTSWQSDRSRSSWACLHRRMRALLITAPFAPGSIARYVVVTKRFLLVVPLSLVR